MIHFFRSIRILVPRSPVPRFFCQSCIAPAYRTGRDVISKFGMQSALHAVLTKAVANRTWVGRHDVLPRQYSSM